MLFYFEFLAYFNVKLKYINRLDESGETSERSNSRWIFKSSLISLTIIGMNGILLTWNFSRKNTPYEIVKIYVYLCRIKSVLSYLNPALCCIMHITLHETFFFVFLLKCSTDKLSKWKRMFIFALYIFAHKCLWIDPHKNEKFKHYIPSWTIFF